MTPAEFDQLPRTRRSRAAFSNACPGPLVRSSYRAEQALNRNNAGLDNAGSRRERRHAGGGPRCRARAPRAAASAGAPSSGWCPTSRPGARCSASPRRAARRRPMRSGSSSTRRCSPSGMNASRAHLLAPGDIPVVQIDRGGQVTYHGPGQLVVYPLIDLKRAGLGVRDLVTALERAVIALGAQLRDRWPSAAAVRPGSTSPARKLASVGVRVRRQRQLPRAGAERGARPGALRAHQSVWLRGAGDDAAGGPRWSGRGGRGRHGARAAPARRSGVPCNRPVTGPD